MRSAAIILALLLCQLAVAGDLKVRPAPGKFLGYVEAEQPGKWLALRGGESIEFVSLVVVDGGKAAYLEGQAGRYGVVYFPPGDDAQPITTVMILGGGEPTPPPGPDPPDPPDPPVPDLTKLWVLIVRESGDQDPNTAAIVTSAAVRDLVRERGFAMRVVDPDERGPDGQMPSDIGPYLAAMKRDGRTVPHLFVTNDQADLVFDGPLPATVGDMLELLKSLEGRR